MKYFSIHITVNAIAIIMLQMMMVMMIKKVLLVEGRNILFLNCEGNDRPAQTQGYGARMRGNPQNCLSSRSTLLRVTYNIIKQLPLATYQFKYASSRALHG